jgi:hypothetical protein
MGFHSALNLRSEKAIAVIATDEVSSIAREVLDYFSSVKQTYSSIDLSTTITVEGSLKRASKV